MPKYRLLLPILLAAAAMLVVAATVLPGSGGRAHAATPCWKALINDWYDNGRIDATYPVHCYREALGRLPEDIRDYTSLGDDISSALLAAVREQSSHKARHTAARSGGSGEVGSVGRAGEGRPPKGLFRRAADALGPNSTDTVPRPLMILGALALLLMAAGSAGMIQRKLQARRAADPAEPPPPSSE
jgi:hypothetical protein